ALGESGATASTSTMIWLTCTASSPAAGDQAPCSVLRAPACSAVSIAATTGAMCRWSRSTPRDRSTAAISARYQATRGTYGSRLVRVSSATSAYCCTAATVATAGPRSMSARRFRRQCSSSHSTSASQTGCRALPTAARLGPAVTAAVLGAHFHPGGYSLSEREREIAVIILNSKWHSAYPTAAHERRGKEVGLPAEKVEAMLLGLPTSFPDEREQIVYEMAICLSNSRWASKGLHDRAVKALGHVGITDVITLMGYYTSVSMTLAFLRRAGRGTGHRALDEGLVTI